MSIKHLLVGAVVATCLLGGAAQAASISSLYNTGVDAAGAPAANYASEIHYTLDGGANARVANESNGYPNNVWIGDDAASSWIGPKGDSHLDGGYQVYDYRTTFSLAGLDPATASILGRWAVDDVGLDILLNGVSIHPQAAPWNSWTGFAITSGFQAGVNSLDFVMMNTNGWGPTGLRVEMTGTAGAAVPEPATWAMMLAGFGGLGVLLRRRRSETALIVA